MNQHDLAALLGELDTRFLTEAHAAYPRHSRRRVALLAAVLAIVCVVCIGTGVYAATEQGQWILDIFTRRAAGGIGDWGESGYRLDFEIERVPTEALSSEVLALGEDIIAAISAYQPHMSHIPNLQYRRFTTTDEACAFIGYAPLDMPDLGFASQQTTVTVWGDMQGQIGWVSIEDFLSTDDLAIQSFATIYTPYHTGSVGTGVATLNWENFASTEQTTPAGRRCLIVRSTPADGDPDARRTIDAYLVRDSVFYRLHLAYDPRDLLRAEAILADWIAALD